jgi:acetolactate synthase-1/2/3 large subunit
MDMPTKQAHKQPAESPVMNGAQALVRTLESAGVRHVFGYPGGAIMPIYDALIESELIHVLCRHEQGCALAADGYARVSGEVGVCMATSGPGATNLLTGIANAFMDSVPLLAITGQVPTTLMGTDAFQEVDIFGMSMPVVKHSYIVRSSDAVQDTVLEALDIAASGRPGPVLLDLPKDVANAPCTFRHSVITANRPPVEQYGLSDLHRAAAMLRKSRRPLAYVGGGAVISRCQNAVRRLVEHHGIPVVATLKALGVVPTRSDLFLGMIGMHGSKAANFAAQSADLLICIGARFDDRVTGKLDEFAPNADVIHIDIDPAEISKLRHANVSLPGEIGPVLRYLRDQPALQVRDWQSECRELLAANSFDYGYPGEDIFAPALLRRMSEETAAHFGRSPVISCDVGQHQMWVAQHCHLDDAENHLSSAGLGTMGYGLPAAIGAQVAKPGTPVVVVSGDGSIMMNIQELATLKRYQLPVKIIVLDNACLGLVRQWQELFFEERFSEVDLSDNPDFSAVAQSFGIPAMSIERASEVDAGLDFLNNSEGPCLLHVRIDPRANVWPLVPPGKSNEAMMHGPPQAAGNA